MSELTDEQVENWRKAMFYVFGPYAMFLTRASIEQIRAAMQARVEDLQPPKPCDCDPARNGTTVRMNGEVTCNKCGRRREAK